MEHLPDVPNISVSFTQKKTVLDYLSKTVFLLCGGALFFIHHGARDAGFACFLFYLSVVLAHTFGWAFDLDRGASWG